MNFECFYIQYQNRFTYGFVRYLVQFIIRVYNSDSEIFTNPSVAEWTTTTLCKLFHVDAFSWKSQSYVKPLVKAHALQYQGWYYVV